MSVHTRIDLATLPPQLRDLVEALVEGAEVTVDRAGETVGTLSFRPAVLTGTVHTPHGEQGPRDTRLGRPLPEGVKVVVTAMRLSREARRRLGDAMGPGFLVVDFADAPDSADIVLSHPVSPQLLGRFHLLFPEAHVIVTEIHDPELGIDVTGPVGRILDAGVQAYLPARPVEKVAENVQAYLAAHEQRRLARDSGAAAAAFLMPPPDDR
ncbi:MAG: hypothetical protein HOQ13_01520 [Dermatophilaceae bacterium]|nr:hypothetical protein [Dermatophilaceae bacterium]